MKGQNTSDAALAEGAGDLETPFEYTGDAKVGALLWAAAALGGETTDWPASVTIGVTIGVTVGVAVVGPDGGGVTGEYTEGTTGSGTERAEVCLFMKWHKSEVEQSSKPLVCQS